MEDRLAEMTEHPVVLFDGVCNYCNRLVNFLIREDKRKKLRFAPLQSEAGRKLLREYGFPENFLDSFVLISKGRAHRASDAALRLYNQLPWYWKWTQVFWIFPPFLRDAFYRWFARRRYRWFGKTDTCMTPREEVMNRFLQ